MNRKTTDTTHTQQSDLAHPQPVKHNDDEHSRMPERPDKTRKQSPADQPGKKPGEGERSVG